MYRLIIILLSVFLIGQSCSKKIITRKYYVVEFPEQPPENQARTDLLTKATCEIATIKVSPAFAQHRIAVRNKSHQISYYFNHQWAVNPEEVFTHLLESHLQSQHIFTSVSRSVWKVIPEYQVNARVEQLEIIEQEDQFSAHLAMSLRFQDNNNRNTILLHSFDRSEILEEKNINLFAANISRIYLEELNEFSKKIRRFVLRQAGPKGLE